MCDVFNFPLVIWIYIPGYITGSFPLFSDFLISVSQLTVLFLFIWKYYTFLSIYLFIYFWAALVWWAFMFVMFLFWVHKTSWIHCLVLSLILSICVPSGTSITCILDFFFHCVQYISLSFSYSHSFGLFVFQSRYFPWPILQFTSPHFS